MINSKNEEKQKKAGLRGVLRADQLIVSDGSKLTQVSLNTRCGAVA